MEGLGLVKRMRRYSPSIITGVKARYMCCRYKEVGRGMEGAGGNFLLVAFFISVKLEVYQIMGKIAGVTRNLKEGYHL